MHTHVGSRRWMQICRQQSALQTFQMSLSPGTGPSGISAAAWTSAGHPSPPDQPSNRDQVQYLHV